LFGWAVDGATKSRLPSREMLVDIDPGVQMFELVVR
jgi:hypothetical protein